jgi:prepilin-type N-terminal cleavage/methylation domain-containing protein
MIASGAASRRLRGARCQQGITLVELLIAMSIMSVITALLLLGWFALSKSYGFAVHSADARDSGRQAMQRLQREIRDAQKPPQGYLGTSTFDAPDAIIYRARPYFIAFSSTFNDAGNATAAWTGTPTPTPSPTRPHLIVYKLYTTDHELWRFEDLNNNGKIDVTSGSFDMLSDGPSSQLAEQQAGEGATLLVTDVVNCADLSHPATWVPLFQYNYYDSAGVLQSEPRLVGADRQAIIAVQIRLLVDLDPTKAPLYADLRGTAQLRNAR